MSIRKGVNMKSKGSILETRSQHGRQRVNIGDMESKWKTVGQHWSQRVNMKGQGLILETRVNMEDRGQHSRQGVTMVDKGSTVEIRGQKGWQAVNIRGKEQTLETRRQHWEKMWTLTTAAQSWGQKGQQKKTSPIALQSREALHY